jgi:hypothetical protein
MKKTEREAIARATLLASLEIREERAGLDRVWRMPLSRYVAGSPGQCALARQLVPAAWDRAQYDLGVAPRAVTAFRLGIGEDDTSNTIDNYHAGMEITRGTAPVPQAALTAMAEARAALGDALEASGMRASARRRAWRDFDGDGYDFDRGESGLPAWEGHARALSRAQGQLCIAVNPSLSYRIPGPRVSAACGWIAGIVDALEASGVRCELLLFRATHDKATDKRYGFIAQIKGAGEPLDPECLLRVTGPWSHRTIGWDWTATIDRPDDDLHSPTACFPAISTRYDVEVSVRDLSIDGTLDSAVALARSLAAQQSGDGE